MEQRQVNAAAASTHGEQTPGGNVTRELVEKMCGHSCVDSDEKNQLLRIWDAGRKRAALTLLAGLYRHGRGARATEKRELRKMAARLRRLAETLR